jgi:hypothetical protein
MAMREIDSRCQRPIGFLKSPHLSVLSFNSDSSKTRFVVDSANAIVGATPGVPVQLGGSGALHAAFRKTSRPAVMESASIARDPEVLV